MEINFYKFKDKEPKLTFEETIIDDDPREKGYSIYASKRILVQHEGVFFLGRFRKKLSNYDNHVEELYIDIEVAAEAQDRITKESYILPLQETLWAEI